MTILLFIIMLSTVWTIAGLVALHRAIRREPLDDLPEEGVTVLKPLCGVDDDLTTNLRTFFEQDHPKYELIFGVVGQDDPAIEVVRSLRGEYPSVNCRLVIHDGGRGVNPKVCNLRAMVSAATHDLMVISDSNVTVDRDYLQVMARELNAPGVGLVTSVVVGVGEESLGATLENLQLNGSISSSVALPNALGVPVVLGKSMMFRSSKFERLGGFESVANVLAEDYVIGRMFAESGERVVVSSQTVRCVSRQTTLMAFFKRHQRWGMMRLRLNPFAFGLEWLTLPMVVALVSPIFGASTALVWAWALSLSIFRDAAQWRLLRGATGMLPVLPLGWFRELVVFAAWLSVPFRKHVTWRGNRVRVSAGTRLYAEEAPNAPTCLWLESSGVPDRAD